MSVDFFRNLRNRMKSQRLIEFCCKLPKPEFKYTESAYMFWREGKGKEDSISESAVRRAV